MGRESRHLRTDDRGTPASQLDFVNGMAIILGASVLFYFLLGNVMVQYTEGSTHDDRISIRIADKLTEDLWRGEAGDSHVSHTCFDAYISQTDNDDCGIDANQWPGDAPSYLRESLGLDELVDVQLEIEDTSGGVVDQFGQTPPNQEIAVSKRYFQMDRNGDGDVEWYKLTVMVW